MSSQILHNEITRLIEQIRRRHELLRKIEGKLPHLEIDLLLGDLRTLYEFCHDLEHINDEEVTLESIPDPAILVPGASHAASSVASPAPQSAPVVPAPPPQAMQPPPQPVTGNVNLFNDAATVGARYEDKPTIHDKLSASEEKSVASRHKQAPISDLRSSIGINEKFIFLNELFEGNSAEYNETIEKLNTCITFEEAETLLKSGPSTRHNWNIRNKFVRADFWDLVQRRFNQQ